MVSLNDKARLEAICRGVSGNDLSATSYQLADATDELVALLTAVVLRLADRGDELDRAIEATREVHGKHFDELEREIKRLKSRLQVAGT